MNNEGQSGNQNPQQIVQVRLDPSKVQMIEYLFMEAIEKTRIGEYDKEKYLKRAQELGGGALELFQLQSDNLRLANSRAQQGFHIGVDKFGLKELEP